LFKEVMGTMLENPISMAGRETKIDWIEEE
jgi:hypothetical protein